MGNSSSGSNKVSVEQKDLQFLGDRFPFGDMELQKLYRIYHSWISTDSLADNKQRSFLQELARLSDFTEAVGGQQQGNDDSNTVHVCDTMRQIEEQLLPRHFSQMLYSTSFCILAKNSNNVHSINPGPVDEFTRMARMERFFEGLSNCTRRGSKAVLTTLFDALLYSSMQPSSPTATKSNEKEETNHTSSNQRVCAVQFVELGYRLALATAYLKQRQASPTPTEKEVDIHDFLPQNHEVAMSAMAHSIVEKGRRRRQRSGMPGVLSTECPYLEQKLVELEDILEWSESVAPVFACILPTLFHHVIFPKTPFPSGSRTEFAIPTIFETSLFFQQHGQDSPSNVVCNFFCPRLFTVACWTPTLTTTTGYHRLYTSAADGLSFNRLLHAVIGYDGPTLFVVQSSNGDGIFGAYTTGGWKESKDFYGNTDCFLFALHPFTAVYRPCGGNNRNFVYCNSAARSRGYDQQAHGIGFGGAVEEPRLFLSEEDLDNNCVAASQDLTFENGALLPPGHRSSKYFGVQGLEVWGVGDAETVRNALLARGTVRANTDEAIRRARKVDKAQFLDDFQAGTFASKAFQHRQQVDGRADADLEDRNRKGYEYAK
jgi:hypothetical protein